MAYRVADYRTSRNYLREQIKITENFLANPGHPLTEVLRKGTEKQLSAMKRKLKRMEDGFQLHGNSR